jgi:hypothetical protein
MEPKMTKDNEDRKTGGAGWFGALKWEGMREKDRANEKRVNSFAFVWVGFLMVATLLRYFTQVPEPVALALVLASMIPGFLLVKAYLKMLREADEMLRLMQYEALAVGFGAGIVCGFTAMFLLPPSPVWGIATLMPMVLGFCIRVILAGRKIAQEAAASEALGGSDE